jgi:hypothetical protein
LKKHEARKITIDRLSDWTRVLTNEIATPVVLIGICHEGKKSGQPVVLMTSDVDTKMVAAMLATAAQTLLKNPLPASNGRWEVDV